jgi:hypothetical protein
MAMKRPIGDLVIYEDGEPLRVGEKERQRDRHRWELEPASAEDYADRMRGKSQPLRRMGHVDRYGRT